MAPERARTRVAALLLVAAAVVARAPEPPAVGGSRAPVPRPDGSQRHLPDHPPRDGCAGLARAGARACGPGLRCRPGTSPSSRTPAADRWGQHLTAALACVGLLFALAGRRQPSSVSSTDTERHGSRDPAQPWARLGQQHVSPDAAHLPGRSLVSHAPLIRALIALGVLAASLFFALTTPARLGLDLRGGTQIVLETQDSPTVKADARVDRPRAGGAAPAGRRPRRRGAHARPLRRAADHRRAARACRTPGRPPRSSAAPPSSPSTRCSASPTAATRPRTEPVGRPRRPRPATEPDARGWSGRRRRGRPADAPRPSRADRRGRRGRAGRDRPAGRGRLVRHRRLQRRRAATRGRS